MFKNFGKKLEIAGLNVLRVIFYIIAVPVLGVFLASTVLFVGILILYMCLAGALVFASVTNAAVQIWMALAAIFWPDIWQVMASMWAWLWHTFVDGIMFFWPHFKGSVLPLLASLGVLTAIHECVKRMSTKIASIRFMVNPH